MSSPSFENIDQWFFEYTEGNLTPVQEAQFMEFLEENPEILGELSEWKKARILPIGDIGFSAAGLIKNTPFFYRPLTIACSGLMLLLLGWLGFLYFPTQANYASTSLDVNIIPVGERNIFNTKFLNVSNKTTTESINKDNNNHSNHETKIRNELASKSLLKDNANQDNDSEWNQTTEEHNKYNSEFLTDLTPFEIGGTYNSKNFKKIKYVPNDALANNLIDIKISKVDSKVNRSASPSNKFKKNTTIFRKLQRMMGHPVALRRTQQPNYQVPMRTAYAAIPALVGDVAGSRINVSSRVQWLGKANSQLMNTISWDGYLHSLKGGLGIDLSYNGYNYDKLNNYTFGITYSPKIDLKGGVSLEPGIRFKMGMIDLNNASSILGNKVELDRNNIIPLFVNGEKKTGNQLWYRDAGLSLVLNTKWFYLGASADNLSKHYNNFYSNDFTKDYHSNIHYTAVVGSQYRPINYNYKIDGYLFYQKYGNLNELWAGGNFQYKWIQVGAGVNTNADFGTSVGLIFHHVQIHYNLDYTESTLLKSKALSHQLSLTILLNEMRPELRRISM